MEAVTIENQAERDAMRYLEDQAYAVLLGHKEPMRSGEIAGALANQAYTAKLIRHVLASSPRFAQIERKWDLEIRYEDKQRPMERVLEEILGWCGRPMPKSSIANELSQVYQRPAEYYETILSRLLRNEQKYFATTEGLYGLRQWLLSVESESEEDIIFDNDLSETEVQDLRKVADKVDWTADDVSKAASDFVDAAKRPVSNKILGFFIWRALGEKFDPVAAFDTCLRSSALVWLSNGCWATQKIVTGYERILSEMGDKLTEESTDEAIAEAAGQAEAEAEAAPVLSLTISERDLDEVADIVSATGEARMATILERIFEISPRDREYSIAAQGLGDAMRQDSRFIWLGAERWRMADTLPNYVNILPPKLQIPVLRFETPSGEQIDVELEDEGLEGALATEIHNPLVQDVGDHDPFVEEGKEPVQSARCVLTRHHKNLGTFPLCQIPPAFFPTGTNLVQVTLISGDRKRDIWANRDTGVVHDMAKWYSDEMPDSGAVFTLTRTELPDEFTFSYNGETDPLVFIPPNRIQELLELKEEIEQGEVPTFDIMCRIMSVHRKGVPFVTLFTEMNIVRRTTRRLVASILSSYYAFYQKPKSALWHFDEKKVDQGFKRAKRKYVRKES